MTLTTAGGDVAMPAVGRIDEPGAAVSTLVEPTAARALQGQIKVSVVIPVYNPGAYLEGCIQSLLDQTLGPDEYEAIFVDDGSTDASPARLDELAAAHPHMRVIHQPNSGWPGKPRNVGIEAARGRYVYFMDHDDTLGPEALERLYDFAERNGSDIVIGKMAGHGRGAPRMLFTATRDRVTLEDSGIISALSPHKLFRASFLREHGLRFPEGRRRLEDQVFVVEAYFRASTISILADYTCYYHLAREDRANAASGQYDPAGRFDAAYYYRFLREVLDIVERHTEPGPLRDRIHRRFLGRELLGRLGGRRFLLTSPERRRLLLDEIRSVLERYIAPTAEQRLAPNLRIRAALARADRLDLLVEQAALEERIRLIGRVCRLTPLDGRRLQLAVDTELVTLGRPFEFRTADGSVLHPVAQGVGAVVPDEARSLGLEPGGEAQVVLRRCRDSAEILLRGEGAARLAERSGAVRIAQSVEVVIDPDSPAEDFALRHGRWEVMARLYLAGHTAEVPLYQRAGVGRSRPLVLVDGVLAEEPARWGAGVPAADVAYAALSRGAGRRLVRSVRRRLPA